MPKICINRFVHIILLVLIIISILILISENLLTAGKGSSKDYRAIIVLDAGHGGTDPGKVSVSGKNEKDINLEIVKRTQILLEQNDFKVILTRKVDLCYIYGYRELFKRKKVGRTYGESLPTK